MQNTKQKPSTKQKLTIAAIFGAMGPGLLAALSGNDAGGISTYSTVGAKFGFGTLWVIPMDASRHDRAAYRDAGDRGALRMRHG